MKQIAILGRQEKLGLAELSVQLNGAIQPLGNGYVSLDEPLANPNEFGSIVRLVTPIGTIKNESWQELLQFAEEHIYTKPPEESGKINLAITPPRSLKLPFRRIQSDLLTLKKRLRSNGYSIRMIMPKDGSFNAAQVKASKLASEGNYELHAIKTKDGIVIGDTMWCQDIDAYAKRDYERPMRDGFVGMLPPKLTQTMLNIANVKENGRILDPFCGTGVVLQEALLKGYEAYGSDLAEKMVEYTEGNLEWLRKSHDSLKTSTVEAGDARTHKWSTPIDGVVCETYLGNPQTGIPNDAQLKQLRKESVHLMNGFLTNLHKQLKPGTPVVLAVPAWKTKKGDFIDSPVVDSINRLGYTRTKLEHVSSQDLMYFRPDQYVARRILVLTRQ